MISEELMSKVWEAYQGDPMEPKNNTEAGLRRVVEVVMEHASTPSPETHMDLSREAIDTWLSANCGTGIPFKEAMDQASMLHGLAYVLRQIEGTNKYMVNIGQTGPATSALRMALDRFAVKALTAMEVGNNS